jgi:glycosyltransferase involved in cell wall biosynthesis
MAGNRGLVTVGVPCYNCAGRIEETVGRILANDFQDYELLLTEGGSTDNTIEVLRGLERRDSRIRVVTGAPSDLPGKRHTIMNEARGRLLVFCDDDILVCREWIGAYVRTAKYWPSVMAGPIIPAGPGPATGIRKSTRMRVWPPTFWNRVLYWRFCAGGNFACPTELAKAVGGWDSAWPQGEDSDFYIRLLDSGHGVCFVPDARGYHPPLPNWDAYVAKRHSYALGDVLLLRVKHRKRFASWCSIAVFFGIWVGVFLLDLLTVRPRRIRLGWARLSGGFKGLFGSKNWAKHGVGL